MAMIAEVKEAKEEVRLGFILLASAKKRLKQALGEYHDHLWQSHISDYSLDREAKDSAALIERNAWKSIVSRLEVWSMLSIKKGEELSRQLDKGDLPPLTEEAVFAFMEQLYNHMGTLLEDSVQEVFDWLRPTHNWRQLKTHEKNVFGLTDKVIIEYGMEDNWGMPSHVNYYDQKYFKALDNVFHLLDGQGIAKYPLDICTVIRSAGDAGQTKCSTPYFDFKWFKNRNLHIKFRRMDLVTKLNQLAGSDKIAKDMEKPAKRE
jgi:hypothetical protein